MAEDGERMSFVESKRVARALNARRTKLRRKIVRLASDAIRDGVGTVNLVSPRWVYEELFSFTGLGTLFTPAQYGTVSPISIDDFEEVEALIVRAQDAGFLLPRSRPSKSRAFCRRASAITLATNILRVFARC